MNLEITVRHTNLSQDMENTIRERVQRIEKFLRGSPRVELILDHEHETYRCEMIAHASRKGGHTVAHDEGDDLLGCIDQVLEKMGRQLVKYNDRQNNHHRRPRGEGREVPPADEPQDEPSYEDIVQREIKGK